ncbi:phosphomannose isomerase type II C-terminal cupin domain [bacterium]|nr:phosphomannose isomerase type II C-terminal cupin domain [bacterium]
MRNKQSGENIKRPWGYYRVIAQGKNYAVKILHVNVGQKLSVQSHKYRSEHWVVASGKAQILLNDKTIISEVGQSVDIPLGSIHSLQNPYNEDLEVLELQMGEIISEDDITRYSDIYGRA